MQIYQDDQLRLEDQIAKIRGQYQQENDAFDKIVDWQGVYRNPPSTLPCYSRKEKIKDQVFFDTLKPLLEDIQVVQKIAYKTNK
jgi:hypothetical protein